MDILSIHTLRDGGSVFIETDRGNFFIDRRIRSKNKGSLYYGVPEKDDRNKVQYPNDLLNQLRDLINSSDFKFIDKEWLNSL